MAISYRPDPDLHDKLRAESTRSGIPIQKLLDAAVQQLLDRREKSVKAIAASVVSSNRELFDRLADK